MNINQRLQSLRIHLKNNGLDACIIPSSDPHQSEYVATRWLSRSWISGFSGSAGLAVVSPDHAGLWTDSRYFLQAEQELSISDFELHKLNQQGHAEHTSWLVENVEKGGTVGIDGWVFSIQQVRRLQTKLGEKGIQLKTDFDPVDPIWEDRPSVPAQPVFELASSITGESRAERIKRIRALMWDHEVDYYLVSTLDDIAWFTNLRGSDIDFNPVFLSYAIIGLKETWLFTDESRIDDDALAHLKADQVHIHSYDSIGDFVKAIHHDQRILLDQASTSFALSELVPEACRVMGSNLIKPLKAIKNEVEVQHIKQAMIKDGVALTRLYRWVEQEVSSGSITEVTVAQKLDECRRAQGDYHGESFPAIVGYAGNGAIVHYRPQAETCATLLPEGILLLDSGGQYTQGTTDITRTTALGEPSAEVKRNFTLVLKGHIGLAMAHFPKGTRGVQLDTLARQHLWSQHLDYGHGTGHGVGFFLNVHEPPQGFAPAISERGRTVLEPGMFTSNEPGFYQTDAYGIRIENLVLTVEAAENEFGHFLRFETLTLFPIDQKLIEKSLLTDQERSWLNAYHAQVNQTLAPHLTEAEQNWMNAACAPIE